VAGKYARIIDVLPLTALPNKLPNDKGRSPQRAADLSGRSASTRR
jgi:hypothetical protein